MLKMVENEIVALKSKLNNMIENGYDFTEVYEISVKLDGFILQYIMEDANACSCLMDNNR